MDPFVAANQDHLDINQQLTDQVDESLDQQKRKLSAETRILKENLANLRLAYWEKVNMPMKEGAGLEMEKELMKFNYEMINSKLCMITQEIIRIQNIRLIIRELEEENRNLRRQIQAFQSLEGDHVGLSEPYISFYGEMHDPQIYDQIDPQGYIQNENGAFDQEKNFGFNFDVEQVFATEESVINYIH